jgi:hypothetical protein
MEPYLTRLYGNPEQEAMQTISSYEEDKEETGVADKANLGKSR